MKESDRFVLGNKEMTVTWKYHQDMMAEADRLAERRLYSQKRQARIDIGLQIMRKLGQQGEWRAMKLVIEEVEAELKTPIEKAADGEGKGE